jgi:chromosome segregation ATPase
MKALQAKSVDLDKQVTAAQGKLRTLKATKVQNQAAIKTQTDITNGLEDQLGVVQRQIKALDATIVLGGCVA